MKTFKHFLDEARMRGFIDPMEGQSPSGKHPIENLMGKNDEIKNKAIKGFLKQLSRKDGGKFAAHVSKNGINIYKYSRN